MTASRREENPSGNHGEKMSMSKERAAGWEKNDLARFFGEKTALGNPGSLCDRRGWRPAFRPNKGNIRKVTVV
ncbi:unnamed protein product [Larinioides sclopetarius]|uniref:Uncharacterized protein n=1 Tax=Larinioides sclopetarius TaxID=280406 RepID=A0AAV1YRC3_9ARAC